MSLTDQEFVCGFPGIANAGALSIGDGDSVNGIRILMVHHEDIMISATRGDREATGLVRIGLEYLLLVEQEHTQLMRARFECRSSVEEGVVRNNGFGRSNTFGFLVLMAKSGGQAFG